MNLEELKKLCAEATPIEKWSVTLDGPDDGQFEYATGPWHDQTNGNTDGAHHDALFIAAAREAMPKLLEVARWAKAVSECQLEPCLKEDRENLAKALAALESPNA